MTTVPAWVGVLPHILAVLNALAVILVMGGFLAIRRGVRPRHQAFMITALVVSVLFLVVYATYHAHVGNVKFAGEGNIRYVYFTLLVSHVLLAVVNLPLVLMTAYRAMKEDFIAHRRLASTTVMVWLYVSLSGLVVYWMAFHAYVPV